MSNWHSDGCFGDEIGIEMTIVNLYSAYVVVINRLSWYVDNPEIAIIIVILLLTLVTQASLLCT